MPPLDQATLERSLVVCLGVLEQLARPEILARDLARIRHRCAFLLVGTPDRARLRGLLSEGPPPEPDRVKEWTAEEFGRFWVDCGFPANLLLGHAVSIWQAQGGHSADFSDRRILGFADAVAPRWVSGRWL